MTKPMDSYNQQLHQWEYKQKTMSLHAAWPLLAFVMVSTSQCVVVTHGHARSDAPPPPAPPPEQALHCVAPEVRIAGHWRWNGYRYLWIPQRCAFTPGLRVKSAS